jgi:hypothetical protein
VAPRETGLAPEAWQAAEAASYRDLLQAVQALVRFGERLRLAPDGIGTRFALASVSAVLREEGVWLGPEQIALYQALRMSSDDTARDLARAGWAVQRLSSQGWTGVGAPTRGLRDFLGRGVEVGPLRPGPDRPEPHDLDQDWQRAMARLDGCHPLTRAAYGFAVWRAWEITPWEAVLEPMVAVMLTAAQGMAPFLPLAAGRCPGRGGGGSDPAARLAETYAAAHAGALQACLELDRLLAWEQRARKETEDLSGRIPAALIKGFLRFPVLSADLAAHWSGATRVSARRNLNLLQARGLIREVTGQDRYRFWAIRV